MVFTFGSSFSLFLSPNILNSYKYLSASISSLYLGSWNLPNSISTSHLSLITLELFINSGYLLNNNEFTTPEIQNLLSDFVRLQEKNIDDLKKWL